MGLLKALVLGIGLLGFGLLALCFSLLAVIISPVLPNVRFYSNSFFLIPFGIFARAVVGIRLTVLHSERLRDRRPAILVGNHQSGLDLGILGTVCPSRTVIVGKREILRIPGFGWFFWLAGNLMINRSDRRDSMSRIEAIRKTLARHQLNLAIFPEGTRSVGGEILPFKRGAFHVAVASGYPLIPVVCSGLEGRAVWERFQLRGGNVVVSVLDPIETKGVEPHEIGALGDRVRSLMVEEYRRVTELAKTLDLG